MCHQESVTPAYEVLLIDKAGLKIIINLKSIFLLNKAILVTFRTKLDGLAVWHEVYQLQRIYC